MRRARIIVDPDGLYARLGVTPDATPASITLAYRRKARVLHPDVPRTGDAAAFMALKEAYDTLSNPRTREAYDESGREEVRPGAIDPAPFPDMVAPATRHPRLRDLPMPIWVGIFLILAFGAVEVGRRMPQRKAPSPESLIPATAPGVPPIRTDAPARAWARAEGDLAPYGDAPVRLAGTPTFYVTPAATAAQLWRADDGGERLVPWGQLPAFSGVQGLRTIQASGMVEVKVTENANGFIDAARLTPGDALAATRAWCTYHSGSTPANGEVLSRAAPTDAPPGATGNRADAAGTLAIANTSGQAMVVKLRAASGALVASVFVEAGAQTILDRLPPAQASVEFATGEGWSRPCHGFTAGMRAQRFPGMIALGGAAKLTVPPDRTVPLTQLTDIAFEQE
jgi:DnaJ domain